MQSRPETENHGVTKVQHPHKTLTEPASKITSRDSRQMVRGCNSGRFVGQKSDARRGDKRAGKKTNIRVGQGGKKKKRKNAEVVRQSRVPSKRSTVVMANSEQKIWGFEVSGNGNIAGKTKRPQRGRASIIQPTPTHLKIRLVPREHNKWLGRGKMVSER